MGVLASVALGLIFGLPTLRLRADYLAIVTITAGETLRIIVNAGGENSLTRGPFGIQQFADSFFDDQPDSHGTYGPGPGLVLGLRPVGDHGHLGAGGDL